jgi:hypothetical protein
MSLIARLRAEQARCRDLICELRAQPNDHTDETPIWNRIAEIEVAVRGIN